MAICTGNTIASFTGPMAAETIRASPYIIKGRTAAQAIASCLIGQKIHVCLAVATWWIWRTGTIPTYRMAIVTAMVPLVHVLVLVTSRQAGSVLLQVVPIFTSRTVNLFVCCVYVTCGAVQCHCAQFTSTWSVVCIVTRWAAVNAHFQQQVLIGWTIFAFCAIFSVTTITKFTRWMALFAESFSWVWIISRLTYVITLQVTNPFELILGAHYANRKSSNFRLDQVIFARIDTFPVYSIFQWISWIWTYCSTWSVVGSA